MTTIGVWDSLCFYGQFLNPGTPEAGYSTVQDVFTSLILNTETCLLYF